MSTGGQVTKWPNITEFQSPEEGTNVTDDRQTDGRTGDPLKIR